MNLQPNDIAVLTSACSLNLYSLNLAENQLGEAAVQQLVTSNWPSLKVLILDDNHLDDAALKQLVTGRWPQLQALQVFQNRITYDGFQHLSSAQWPCTTSLTCQITDLPSAMHSHRLVWIHDKRADVGFDRSCIVVRVEWHTSEHLGFHVKTCEHLCRLQTAPYITQIVSSLPANS